jgi:hypothetical protein
MDNIQNNKGLDCNSILKYATVLLFHHGGHLPLLIYQLKRTLSIYPPIHLSMGLQPFVEPWPFFQFYIAGRTPSTGEQKVARPLPAHRTTQTK